MRHIARICGKWRKTFVFRRKKDLAAYATYCVQCACDRYCTDEVSKALGKTFFYEILKAFEA